MPKPRPGFSALRCNSQTSRAGGSGAAATSRVLVLSPRSAQLHDMLPPKKAADTAKLVISPMPGLVVSLDVASGQSVRSGEQVAIIEAMKMQNILRAERDGVVKAVGAKAGDPVAADDVLVEFE